MGLGYEGRKGEPGIKGAPGPPGPPSSKVQPPYYFSPNNLTYAPSGEPGEKGDRVNIIP